MGWRETAQALNLALQILAVYHLLQQLKSENSLSKSYSKPIQQCYIPTSKIADLLNTMNKTIQVLNRNQSHHLECNRQQQQLQLVQVNLDQITDHQICPPSHIKRLQSNMKEVVDKLAQISATSDLFDNKFQRLRMEQIRLIQELEAVRVIHSHVNTWPCDIAPSVLLFPFDLYVQDLKLAFDSVFDRLQALSPTISSSPSPTHPTSPPPTIVKKLKTSSSTTKSFAELLNIALLNPAAMSAALPELIPQLLIVGFGNLDSVLNFIAVLPTAENQVIGYSAIWKELQRTERLPEVPQLLKLAENVKRLNDTAATIPSLLDSAAKDKLNFLVENLQVLMLIGKTALCKIYNAAHHNHALHADFGYRRSSAGTVYVSNEEAVTWVISPSTKGGKQLTFRITCRGFRAPLAASDTNQGAGYLFKEYKAKDTERYVVLPLSTGGATGAEAEIDWIITPGKPNEFRIVGSKFNDVLFADTTDGNFYEYRKPVFMKRGSSAGGSMFPYGEDRWTFDCNGFDESY